MELNPNHPVALEVLEQWHKLAAIVLYVLGKRELEITETDIQDFRAALGEGAAIVCDTRGGKLTLRLVNGVEALRLAREEGGLPV